MVCIYCGSKTQVTNSRAQLRTNSVWRRRSCSDCQAVFTSIETPSLEKSIVVQYSSGQTAPFIRELLYISIYNSCRHRKLAVTDASSLTNTILSKLLIKVDQATLQRDDIVKSAIKVLKHFDNASMVQYSAFHPI